MVYRIIGLMSGSSLDGLDVAYVEFTVSSGKWSYEIKAATCYPYSNEWVDRLRQATSLDGYHYQLLHVDYGHFLGEQVNRFIDEHALQYQVALITSHGHTTFHVPGKKLTAQLGDGAAIAAETGLPVVSDLRALDVALGGQGAPIVPIGEKLLLGEYDLFLNLGGIANISFNDPDRYIAFDICPANQVLNLLSKQEGNEFDDGGKMAAKGNVNESILELLNALDYYSKPFPKSLSNEFGPGVVYPIINSKRSSIKDALRTYVEHVVVQVKNAVDGVQSPVASSQSEPAKGKKILVTGGGAFNTFLVNRLTDVLQEIDIDVVVPNEMLVKYKEALIMALIGVLRWRQEYNTISSVTGASSDTIGGALWNGQEA
jgi:anhydro-N-acetylmuramic acid kinase